MKILTVDIGTGTQDIYLFNSMLDPENGYKMILPSPTMILNQKFRDATKAGKDVLLTGVTMGGGPGQWAADAHLKAGFNVFATPDAARSFNDDLDEVRQMGIRLVSEDEAARFSSETEHLELRDFDFQLIAKTFAQFSISLKGLDAVAVAVFDHGTAPAGVSDRKFRFDYLDACIRNSNRLSAFAYRAEAIPAGMTRMQAVAHSAQGIDSPLLVMDTAPAAILGATLDPVVRACRESILVNIGNLHTLAFHLNQDGIAGVFEHHTGLLDQKKLDAYLWTLADGSIKNEDVFNDHGHGALVYEDEPFILPVAPYGVAITGPRRKIMANSAFHPYFPAPYGDMMICGCYGLLAATADLLPQRREEIMQSLLGSSEDAKSPWDVDTD
jgi:uncharacterized protein (DUF1786 family)